MKKIISFVWLCAVAASLVSCDQKEEETTSILPGLEATMDRTFDYLESDEADRVFYTLSLSEMQLLSDDEKLEMIFAPDKPVRMDAVVFNIKKTELKNGFVGQYKIKSLTNRTGQAELTYYHYHNKTNSNALFSVGNQMEGSFEIETYNASTGLASGRYVVNIKNVTDPKAYKNNPLIPRKCDITLSGEFNNLKLN